VIAGAVEELVQRAGGTAGVSGERLSIEAVRQLRISTAAVLAS
jgi:hypothetical protein